MRSFASVWKYEAIEAAVHQRPFTVHRDVRLDAEGWMVSDAPFAKWIVPFEEFDNTLFGARPADPNRRNDGTWAPPILERNEAELRGQAVPRAQCALFLPRRLLTRPDPPVELPVTVLFARAITTLQAKGMLPHAGAGEDRAFITVGGAENADAAVRQLGKKFGTGLSESVIAGLLERNGWRGRFVVDVVGCYSTGFQGATLSLIAGALEKYKVEGDRCVRASPDRPLLRYGLDPARIRCLAFFDCFYAGPDRAPSTHPSFADRRKEIRKVVHRTLRGWPPWSAANVGTTAEAVAFTRYFSRQRELGGSEQGASVLVYELHGRDDGKVSPHALYGKKGRAARDALGRTYFIKLSEHGAALDQLTLTSLVHVLDRAVRSRALLRGLAHASELALGLRDQRELALFRTAMSLERAPPAGPLGRRMRRVFFKACWNFITSNGGRTAPASAYLSLNELCSEQELGMLVRGTTAHDDFRLGLWRLAREHLSAVPRRLTVPAQGKVCIFRRPRSGGTAFSAVRGNLPAEMLAHHMLVLAVKKWLPVQMATGDFGSNIDGFNHEASLGEHGWEALSSPPAESDLV